MIRIDSLGGRIAKSATFTTNNIYMFLSLVRQRLNPCGVWIEVEYFVVPVSGNM